jgi:hypothetical protein
MGHTAAVGASFDVSLERKVFGAMTQPSDKDKLVQVASYLNVAEAELARALLAMDGIPACLGNAAFLVWCWHFSNASGGVRVLVAQQDAHRARAILFSRGTPPQWQPSPWFCPKCRAEVNGMWQVCWACGTAKDGTEAPAFFEKAEGTGGLHLVQVERCVGLLTGAFMALFLLMEREPAVIVAWLATMLCLGLRQTVQQTHHGETATVPAKDVERATSEAPDSTADAESENDGLALRAWRSSVLALISVPPLAIYALWLLRQIAVAKAPLRPASRWRVRGAWVLGLLALPFGLAWLAILVLAPFGLLAAIAARLFDVSGTSAKLP